MEKLGYKKTIINTGMLYVLAVAKIIFPLLTLPYLTRVLTVECYGVVSYVKSIMGYMQLIIDFGFILSSVKNIIKANKNLDEISYIVGDTIFAKILLSFVAFVIFLILASAIPLLRANFLFSLLSFFVPFLSCFLLDFLFRGIEKMHIVTIIFVFMKTISTVLTILIIKGDNQILLIPIFDIISSISSVILSWLILKKIGYKIRFSGIKSSLFMIKDSFQYFLNSIASTAFGALTTIIIGAYLNNLQQIAYWSVCIQLIGAVQAMYTPLSNGIYPYMIRKKDMGLIKKIMIIFTPIILGGTVFCYFASPYILLIISGKQYVDAAYIFRYLLPVLVFSFPVAIYGYPVLGAINKVKEINKSTITGALVQVLSLFILIAIKQFTVKNIAIFRNVSEIVMCFMRLYYVHKYKYLMLE